MDKNVKILLYTHGGSENHGCEAITRTTHQIISQWIPNCSMTLCSLHAEQDYKYEVDRLKELAIVGEDRYRKYSMRNIFHKLCTLSTSPYKQNISYKFHTYLDKIKDQDIALSVGGDNYCYEGYEKSLSSYNWYFTKQNIKTVLWGASVEEVIMNRDVIEDMKRYSLITCRESISYETLLNKGISQEKVKLYPDPAFTLQKENGNLPEGLSEGNMIGINISPQIIANENQKDIVKNNVFELVNYIMEKTNLTVLLIPHVVWQNSDDIKALDTFYRFFKETGRIFLIEDQSCKKLKDIISKCELFIGSRTHATIAAYSSCVPTLALGYSVKAKGIAKDIFGYDEDFVLPIQSLEKDNTLIERFIWLLANKDAIKRHLQATMPYYIKKAYCSGESINQLRYSK